MKPYLVYWRDLSFSEWPRTKRLGTLDWHTGSDQLLRAIEREGVQLWVVTHGGDTARDEWRLAEVFEVEPQKAGPKNHAGKRRVVGTLHSAQLFAQAQGDFTPILAQLTFASGRPISVGGRRIGQCIQAPRPLSAADVQLLTTRAKNLPQRQ